MVVSGTSLNLAQNHDISPDRCNSSSSAFASFRSAVLIFCEFRVPIRRLPQAIGRSRNDDHERQSSEFFYR